MIVLGRHGNTFAAGERAVWVGAASDLPLVEEGFAQAARVATYLRAHDLAPARVFAGPLRRTREFAAVVAGAFGVEVEIDDGLREIDYGGWERLDNAEVAARFGEEALRAWEERLQWPGPGSGWGESEAQVTERIGASLARLATLPAPVYACTSNGVLRFVRRLIDGVADARVNKVRTGAICTLERGDPAPRILLWNESP
jgi:probable phosphoglycerate mutase